MSATICGLVFDGSPPEMGCFALFARRSFFLFEGFFGVPATHWPLVAEVASAASATARPWLSGLGAFAGMYRELPCSPKEAEVDNTFEGCVSRRAGFKPGMFQFAASVRRCQNGAETSLVVYSCLPASRVSSGKANSPTQKRRLLATAPRRGNQRALPRAPRSCTRPSSRPLVLAARRTARCRFQFLRVVFAWRTGGKDAAVSLIAC